MYSHRRRRSTADTVRLQEGVSGAGFTDIEILAGEGDVHIVIEAKRGYNLPAARAAEEVRDPTEPKPTALFVCAEASAEFVDGKLPDAVAGVPVLYRSWREIEALVTSAATVSRRHAEKRLLRDLSRYLKGLMTMQNVSSNLVYVVSLGGEIEDTGMSFRDVVVEHDTYFCPFGGSAGWPKSRRTISASASTASCSRFATSRTTGSPTTTTPASSPSRERSIGPASGTGSSASAR